MDDVDEGDILRDLHAGRLVATAAAILVLIPIPSEARVFFRWRTGNTVHGAFESMGARSVYRGRMLINGASGEVEVFACPSGIRDTVADMRRDLGTNAADHSGGTMAIGKAREGGEDYRFVIVQLSSVAETMVFAISQPREASAQSLEPIPITRRVPSVPSYPGSRPLFFVSEQDRNSSLGVSSTPDTPEGVRLFYAETLAAQGWKPATGVANVPDRPGMTVFIRGSEILCCQAGAGADGLTKITLLHKRQGLN